METHNPPLSTLTPRDPALLWRGFCYRIADSNENCSRIQSIQDRRRGFRPEPDAPAHQDFAVVHSELKFFFFAAIQFPKLSIFNGNNVSPRR